MPEASGQLTMNQPDGKQGPLMQTGKVPMQTPHRLMLLRTAYSPKPLDCMKLTQGNDITLHLCVEKLKNSTRQDVCNAVDDGLYSAKQGGSDWHGDILQPQDCDE